MDSQEEKTIENKCEYNTYKRECTYCYATNYPFKDEDKCIYPAIAVKDTKGRTKSYIGLKGAGLEGLI